MKKNCYRKTVLFLSKLLSEYSDKVLKINIFSNNRKKVTQITEK